MEFLDSAFFSKAEKLEKSKELYQHGTRKDCDWSHWISYKSTFTLVIRTMNQRPTVLLLIPHLGGGGAEGVVAHLARGLDAARFDLHLGVVTNQGRPGESPPGQIMVHKIGAVRVRNAPLRLVKLVRRLRPDVILSGMAHLNFLVLLLRPLFPRKTRVLVRQNGPLLPDDCGGLALLSYRVLYPMADGVICQTPAMAKELSAVAAMPGKVRVLPNPVDVEAIRAVAGNSACHWNGGGPHLLTTGRLAREKGFDLLLSAFSGLQRQYPDADLSILGEGVEKAELATLARGLGIENAVRFAGQVREPAAWFAGATLFLAPSRREGLPNALLEAAAAGMPIVATPAQGGMTELLADKAGVWLAPETSVSGLLTALETALDSLQPGQRFAHPWIDDFRLPIAVRAYEELIEETLVAPR